MKNLLIVLALVTVFTFTANAQSKDCCSKEKGEITKVEKCTQIDHTMKMGDKVETTTTTKIVDGKEIVEKEVVVEKNKMNMKEKCGDKSSCCSNMKKENKIEKEVEKK